MAETPGAQDPPSSEPTEAPIPAQAARALILEDEVLIRMALTRMLEGLGLEVTAVGSAEEALSALDDRDYQLVVSDLRLPGMTGQQFHARACQRRPELAARFVFCTGDTTNPQTQAFAKEAGARLLAKPFLAGDVQAMVRAVVGG